MLTASPIAAHCLLLRRKALRAYLQRGRHGAIGTVCDCPAEVPRPTT